MSDALIDIWLAQYQRFYSLDMTKSVRVPGVGKTLLRNSSVPDTARFMWLFGDPLLKKNIKKHLKNEYQREYKKAGSRRELTRYENEHPEKESVDAFLNLFPNVAKDPLGFAMDRAMMAGNGQQTICDSDMHIPSALFNAKECAERESTSWVKFKEFRQAIMNDSLENPLIPLLNYVYDNGNRCFEDSELVIWLFLVLLEHQFLSYECQIGFSEILFRGIAALDDVSKLRNIEGYSALEGIMPIHVWIPKFNIDGNLSTTRYGVMHHMVQCYLKPEDRERNYKHLHGNEFLTLKKGRHERVLCMNTALGAFHNSAWSSEAKNLLMLIFRAAEVFEMFQLVEYRVGLLPATRIVKAYANFYDIADDFYSAVKKYAHPS